MKNTILNPDSKHVELIMKGLIKKGGYCPCKVGKLDENQCPCDEFIDTSHCHCNLFVEKKEAEDGEN